MIMHKNTIMGQVLAQVRDDKKNKKYFEQIDDLLEDIQNEIYLDINEIQAWNKNGLSISYKKNMLKEEKDPEWVYVYTDYVEEYSWFVEELVDIYNPKKMDMYRLLTTIGYLLNIYSKKYRDLRILFKLITITSTIFLHPDHLGLDRFRVYPLTLPTFGQEF